MTLSRGGPITSDTAQTTTAAAGGFDTQVWNYIGLAVLVFIWASNFSVVKYALGDFSPLAFNGLRFAIASVLLYLFLRLRGGSARMERRHLLALVVLGVVGNTIYQVLFIYGIDWTLAGNAALMLSATPIFTTLLSVQFGQERLAAAAWAGVIISFIGIGLVVLGGARAVEFSSATVRGDLTMLGAALAWSIYTVGANPLIRHYGPLPVTAVTMWIGGAGLLLVSTPSLWQQNWRAVSTSAWLSLLYSGVFAIAVAYFLWYYSIRHIGNTRTAVYTNAIPIVALLIAWMALGEVPTWLQIVGAAGILGGALLARLGRIEGPAIVRPPAE